MENRLHDVLAVVALSDEGKIVLKQAVFLQKVFPFRIFVLHVIPPIKFIFLSRKVRMLKEQALQNLKDFLKDFFGGEIPANVIPQVIMGKIVPTLIAQGRSDNFFFMILKRSLHQKGIPNLLVQNDMDRIIAHSYCPVLSINEDSTPEHLKNILIPIDISESTTKKLLWASLFAKKTSAKIQIVSALKIHIDEQKSLASKNAERIKAMLLERGISCEVEILKASPKNQYESVLDYIETQKPDLVIIRKHNVASKINTTIGDFSKEIIHGSTVPVFTVSQSQSDIEEILG